MQTRDSVRLDADIYRPAGAGSFPVLLMRQPYGRQIASTVCYAHPSWYAERGYIVVIQDVRGRGTSAGVFKAFESELEDGADTVAWAASLPGANGRVGMYGFSYQGSDQLLAAAGDAPALKAIAPAMIGWDIRHDWAYENDAFCLSAGMGWAIQLAAESARLAGDLQAFRELYRASRALPFDDPVPARPDVLERHRRTTHYFDWLDQPPNADYWRRISPSTYGKQLARSGPPALFIGGWFDTHLPGTLAAYRFYAEMASVPCRLIVGPWTHFPWGRRVGAMDYGAKAIGEIDQLQLAWFDHWLKGEQGDGPVSIPAVRLFDMEDKKWRSFGRWPDDGQTWHLSCDGRAALDERDGLLLKSLPKRAAIEYLVHDPWRPVATAGGAYGSPSGTVDRSATDARPDVLTFTSAPFARPSSFAGTVSSSLSVAADAPSFDISCVLSRVTPDGRSFNLTDGYRRVISASESDRVPIPMRAVCVTMQPGERLRLSIACASFPAYPVNPGTGEDPAKAALGSARIITLGVICGGAAGSTLSLSGI